MKYRIKPKMDFGGRGFWIGGKWVRKGFVVTDGRCNIMPGAIWFLTIADAMKAIRIWIEVKGNVGHFWDQYLLDI